MKKMLRLVGLVTLWAMFFANSAAAEERLSYSGIYLSVGKHQGEGNFILSHTGRQFSLGELLDVPVSGTVMTYEVGYRFPVRQSNLRIGVNAVLHQGSIAGVKSWQGYGVTAAVGVASDLRLSFGAEVGVVVGRQQLFYFYAGAGKVASDLSLRTSLTTPWGEWSEGKSGGAIGTHYRIGVEYQFAEHLAGGIEISQMQFEASQAFGLGNMGQQSLDVSLKETLIGVKLTLAW